MLRTALECFVAGLVLAITSVPSLAQTLPDIQDAIVQGEQINRSVADTTQSQARTLDQDDSAIDGEAGLYVLKVNDIFRISASGGIGYTDNSTRTADNPGGSGFADFGLNAGLVTQLNNSVDFSLAANVGGREYFKKYGPSSRTISAITSLGTGLAGPLYISAVAFGGYSYDGKFENGTSFYGLSGSLSAALPLSNQLFVRPAAGLTRQWSGTKENHNSAVSGSVDVIYAITPKVTASLRGIVSKRWYDDFYEDVTFVKRKDTTYGVGAALSYRLNDRITVAANVGYDNQKSSFFLSDFEAVEGGAAISVTFKF